MILADENLHPRLIQSLRSANIDVYSVKEHNRGISDEVVIALSKDPPRIILTEDKDFGEWVFAHHEMSMILKTPTKDAMPAGRNITHANSM